MEEQNWGEASKSQEKPSLPLKGKWIKLRLRILLWNNGFIYYPKVLVGGDAVHLVTSTKMETSTAMLTVTM